MHWRTSFFSCTEELQVKQKSIAKAVGEMATLKIDADSGKC